MNKEEIIKEAIKKASKNGYKKYHGYFAKNWDDTDIRSMIFDHNFAKAFFGEEWKDGEIISTPLSDILAEETIQPWQHHLRQMVIEEYPLLYLAKFLK